MKCINIFENSCPLVVALELHNEQAVKLMLEYYESHFFAVRQQKSDLCFSALMMACIIDSKLSRLVFENRLIVENQLLQQTTAEENVFTIICQFRRLALFRILELHAQRSPSVRKKLLTLVFTPTKRGDYFINFMRISADYAKIGGSDENT